MKQLTFESHEQYVTAQKATVMKRGLGPYFCDLEMQRIAEWCRVNQLQVQEGICHGARGGHECDELMRNMPLAKILGTDLFPHSGKSAQLPSKAEMVEWDFSQSNPKWKERFDLVYTNSLDHSQNALSTLQVWMEQLTHFGALFIQWNRSDLDVKGGDCFGADPLEMIDLLNTVGCLVDMIYVHCNWNKGNYLRRHGLECIVYVVRKKL